jgi:hypothetical protein
LVRAGDETAAAEHHWAALAIDERLAAADPGNAQAQRDLGVSHSRLGSLAVRTGNQTAAAEHFQAALAAIGPLANTDAAVTQLANWLRQRLEEIASEHDRQ